jgi:hypothetical protein
LYKIFSKMLQLQLQPILMEVINQNQLVFLLLYFTIENLLLDPRNYGMG